MNKSIIRLLYQKFHNKFVAFVLHLILKSKIFHKIFYQVCCTQTFFRISSFPSAIINSNCFTLILELIKSITNLLVLYTQAAKQIPLNRINSFALELPNAQTKPPNIVPALNYATCICIYYKSHRAFGQPFEPTRTSSVRNTSPKICHGGSFEYYNPRYAEATFPAINDRVVDDTMVM